MDSLGIYVNSGICIYCGREHEWQRVYYEKGNMLIKAEGVFIAWCYDKNNFQLMIKQ